MAEKVTLSLGADILAHARRAARRDGVSLSTWVERAARRQLRYEAARHHDEWLAANPDVRDELDGFDRFAEAHDSNWSDLTDAACRNRPRSAFSADAACRNRPRSAFSAGAA